MSTATVRKPLAPFSREGYRQVVATATPPPLNAHLAATLREWRVIRLEALASLTRISAESILVLLAPHRRRYPIVRRAGALWVHGAAPKRDGRSEPGKIWGLTR
jgi:hypothetical protein